MPTKAENKPSKILVLATFVAATLTGSVLIVRGMQYVRHNTLEGMCFNGSTDARAYACAALQNDADIKAGVKFLVTEPAIRKADGTPDCVAMKFENVACRPEQVASLPASTSCVP
jgi:hypothetical protein